MSTAKSFLKRCGIWLSSTTNVAPWVLVLIMGTVLYFNSNTFRRGQPRSGTSMANMGFAPVHAAKNTAKRIAHVPKKPKKHKR
ncbi:MAG: hypothetical protein HYR96_02990 [Deltaproteobacteria bacterium]|nr:hypothetical protein [Deltaproteobacteria bacterium]MBI3294065.1 hypothetical protein [Deltaproteobacteria bacterium]